MELFKILGFANVCGGPTQPCLRQAGAGHVLGLREEALLRLGFLILFCQSLPRLFRGKKNEEIVSIFLAPISHFQT
ncbi:hypothetical protein [Algoriphagus limi]|uniref:Uncharacterized protein n=1 Tax=Algoriphagus limi TaxID=2975273 RepID=A0ABT2G204_9BACT|nr:hypothetical protein [Algoriphagus limi]MCS5489298.1 hypothetical protein [Algoriphagus limi]